MPRDLADVLHHFLPESGEAASDEPTREVALEGLPIVAVPIGDRDVVRAAFTWNLAVEASRSGARAAVVAPAADSNSALWPEDTSGPFGVDVVLAPATNIGQLQRAAEDVANRLEAESPEGGLVLVRVPPLWLLDPRGGSALLRWVLLLSSAEPRDLLESYGIAKRVAEHAPGARIGVTIHGARRQGEAEQAFSRLAEVASRRLGQSLSSYGLLVDDLHVYRAIVAQRPIGMVHPQSPAARCMHDVAELLLDDARNARV
jgi:hypothetical protein